MSRVRVGPDSFIKYLNDTEHEKFKKFIGDRLFLTVEQKIEIFKEFLIEYKKITQPNVEYIIKSGTAITSKVNIPTAYNQVMAGMSLNYTLKLISAKRKDNTQTGECKFEYVTIYDNSIADNNKFRHGFTIEGLEKGKMFKQENKLYLENNPINFHYDTLEDINFNPSYWLDICNRTKTSICLFSGATTAFKDNKCWEIFKDKLRLNYYGTREFPNNSVNIFISCENVPFAFELNQSSYTGPESDIRYQNLPCIGFDDLVMQYNSNIVFCRSYISKQVPPFIFNLIKSQFDYEFPNNDDIRLIQIEFYKFFDYIYNINNIIFI